jgi:TatD DNase family protein
MNDTPSVPLFDSHCHLDDDAFDHDLEAVLHRAEQAGVRHAMVVGITLDSSEKAVRLADRYESLFASVGVHPHDAKDCSEPVLERLVSFAANPKVKAWGETGLDFNRMYSPKAVQEKWFSRQLDIADRLNLPVILHERDSCGRFLEILKSQVSDGPGGVVHCFTGSREELFGYLDLGFYIGITGIVTMKDRGAALRQMVPLIPENRMLIETDAPYLTPSPEKNRFRRNEPAFVRSVFTLLSQIRTRDPKTLSESLWNNTCSLYRVDSPQAQVPGSLAGLPSESA